MARRSYSQQMLRIGHNWGYNLGSGNCRIVPPRWRDGGAMAEFRIERDSLGEVQVPANALYGAQTQRAVQNFPVSGMRPYPAFVWAQTLVKRAAAEVNRDLGLLEPRLADAIIAAAEERSEERRVGKEWSFRWW